MKAYQLLARLRVGLTPCKGSHNAQFGWDGSLEQWNRVGAEERGIIMANEMKKIWA